MEKKQPLQNRAYSVLEVRALDADTRTFSGIATTPSVDRMGDIIDPEGVKFTNPLPLLWQHMHDKPIGTVKFSQPTDKGIEFEAEIADITEPGALKDRVDEAWQSIKAGLVRAVSIGFRAIEYNFMESGGIRYSQSEVYELSCVTIPANSDAIITAIKSIDANFSQADKPAATGKGHVVNLREPVRDRTKKPIVYRENIRPDSV